jgi:threonine dehydrogenase-like Zn-dependent dehydrogenase
VIDEITLVGSRCGPFDRAIEALAENKIVVESLISARYPLAKAEEAFRHAQRAGVLKVLFEVGN